MGPLASWLRAACLQTAGSERVHLGTRSGHLVAAPVDEDMWPRPIVRDSCGPRSATRNEALSGPVCRALLLPIARRSHREHLLKNWLNTLISPEFMSPLLPESW